MRNKSEIEHEIKKEDFNWLGRKSFIGDFINHILNKKKSTHICLNGVWGSGKTTTVLGIKNQLELMDENSNPLILYLDAWKYEHYQEPLFALLKVIQKELPDIFDKIKGEFQKDKIEPQMGINLPMFNFNISKDHDNAHTRILNEAEYVDFLHEAMTNAVNKYKEEKSNDLIIFIDELDRAKPNFALRTIEMFHHLQDYLPTHIVYSVDMNQLSSIIKHYYGYEYNVEIFTHKVFDEVITLKKLAKEDIEVYIDRKIREMGTSYDVSEVRHIIIKYLKLNQIESLRTLNKVCKNVVKKLESGYFKAVCDRTGGISLYNYYLGQGSYNVIWGYVELLIILEIYSLSSPMKIYDFLRGENIRELLNYILTEEDGNLNKNLGHLISASFNFDKPETENKTYMDLNEQDIILGLRRLFVPVDPEYRRISVFENNEAFV